MWVMSKLKLSSPIPTVADMESHIRGIKKPRVAKGYHLKYKYGISIEQYDEMFDNQEGCCAICSKHRNDLSRDLHVDHCHETGVVRGLLCMACNTGLGQLGDDISGVKRALAYLEAAHVI